MRSLVRSLLVSCWFMVLTFPLMGLRILEDGSLVWRWRNILYVGVGSFALSFVWRAFLVRKGQMTAEEAGLAPVFALLRRPGNRDRALVVLFFFHWAVPLTLGLLYGFRPALIAMAVAGIVMMTGVMAGLHHKLAAAMKSKAAQGLDPGKERALWAAGIVFFIAVPVLFPASSPNAPSYQVTIMTSALLSAMLGLGLNIVVGQAGLLVLGYIAFYAVGAYTYALLNSTFAIGFWTALPLGGIFAAVAGILLSLPVLRLRGDYLAIVTLGFGEITRLLLINWSDVTRGNEGIANIARPSFFGLEFSAKESVIYVYYLALAMTLLTIVVVARLGDSRLGRSWLALREDEIACEAMGINKVTAKLSAFALGACWAGFGGVLFAARNTYISPPSFTFMESAIILSVVVLGGLGSVLGVILGAFILMLLPEYLRAFEDYRMLIFGGSMVLMMIFRPQGLITPKRTRRRIPALENQEGA